jgi:cysteine desulfuration protein SufE
MVARRENDDKMFSPQTVTRFYKGIIAILIRTFSNQTAQTILEADMDFIDAIGLKNIYHHAANGLVSMIKNIKMYALAFNHKNNFNI